MFPIAAARRGISLAAGSFLLASAGLAAAAANEFQGRWSSNTPHCEQVNGEVDVLTITSSELEFYEVGCKLSKAKRSHNGVQFAARCYKGGGPETSGMVVGNHGACAAALLLDHGDARGIHRCAAQ